MARVFALHDKEPGPPVEIDGDDTAKALNAKGWGIFWVPNEYEGARKRENCTAIRWWFCDIDDGTKEEQLERISCCPLKPSTIVETANGYHCYWGAKDATLTNWDRIVKRGIIPALEADPKASDPLRLLRLPDYYHNKGEPFWVRKVWARTKLYTEAEMMAAFPEHGACSATGVSKAADRLSRELGPATFWVKVSQLSAREVVQRLSGHPLCNGEELRLIETGGGKANIQVRTPGKTWRGTPCWVTAEDTLAGVEGGSSAAAWLKWYGHCWKDIAEGLKQLFPEELGND